MHPNIIHVLGLDLGTSSLKAVVMKTSLKLTDDGKSNAQEIVAIASVSYDEELPHFATKDGVNRDKADNRIYSNPLMWVQALEIVFMKLNSMLMLVDPISIDAVAVSGQQHGTVYWKTGYEEALETFSNAGLCFDLDAPVSHVHHVHQDLHDLATLDDVLLDKAPVWMDSTTQKECDMLSSAMNGPIEVARITGSVPTHRYSGPQIAKMKRELGCDWQDVKRVSLVSSFLTSILIGSVAPIDLSDGSGMNLLDLSTHKWSKMALDALGIDECLLGDVVPSSTIVGVVCKRYRDSFSHLKLDNCHVLAGTGDNPSALVGLLGFRAHVSISGGENISESEREGEAVISLGTSDTLLTATSVSTPKFQIDLDDPEQEQEQSENSHAPAHAYGTVTMCHPIIPDHFMRMICFKNGGIARDYVCSKLGMTMGMESKSKSTWDWTQFSDAIESCDCGDCGFFGFYYPEVEIIPRKAHGIFRYYLEEKEKKKEAEGGNEENEWSILDARAIVESQILAMRANMSNSEKRNLKRIIVTGGGGKLKPLLHVISNVFNVDVCQPVDGEGQGAAIGSCLRALHGYLRVFTFGETDPDPHLQDADVDGDGDVKVKVAVVATPNARCVAKFNDIFDEYVKARSVLFGSSGTGTTNDES